MKLSNKHILLGVSGGIAAYKSAQLLRELQRMGAQVRVAMTKSAKEFVTPLTFQALSGHPVYCDDASQHEETGMDHIAVARWSDAVIVAPATANIIAKLAQGIADDLLTNLCLAHEGYLAVAPAMNQAMWSNDATQANVAELKKRGVHIFGPDSGIQACGEEGAGRMLEPSALAVQCAKLFSSQKLSGRNVVITAGPTVEAIDPVRYITNRSSGKMGYALADAMIEAGAKVTVVSGPTPLPRNDRVNYVGVESAQQMLAAVMEQIDTADILIAAAAVADYQPEKYLQKKIKKNAETWMLSLTRTPDILQTVKNTKPTLFCVGFAAETDNVVANALAKLQKKSLDMIVANQVGQEESGFDSDYNVVEVLWADGQQSIGQARKTQIARSLVTLISNQFNRLNYNSNVSYLPAK